MYFFLFYFFFSLIGLATATYTDLKQRIVSNKITYSLIFFGIAVHLIESIVKADYSIFGFTVLVTILTFFGSFLLWKAGVWAGGDVKLMTGLAALNPLNPNILWNVFQVKIPLFASIAYPIFPLTLFIFSVFSTLPYGIIIAVNGLRKNEKVRVELKEEFGRNVLKFVSFAGLIVGFKALLQYLNLNQSLIIPILLLIVFLLNKKLQLIVSVLAFAFAFYLNYFNALSQLLYFYAVVWIAFLLIKLFFVSRKILSKETKISELKEGDIVAETIVEKNGRIERFAGLEMKKIINYLKNNKLKELKEYILPNGREICSVRNARGLSKEELKELQKLVQEKKIEDRISVKASAPFVPAILIGYLALNIVGDLLWNLML